MTKEEITFYSMAAWDRFCKLYPKLQNFDYPKIHLNNRLRVTAGQCNQPDRIVEIGTKFLLKYPKEILRVTLPHELAHQADFDLYGESEWKHGHGKTWCAIMKKFGLPPDRYHEMKL